MIYKEGRDFMKSVVKMTLEQAIDAYTHKFGGVPWEIICGMPDDEIKRVLTKSLETGKEVTFKRGVLY